MVKFFLFTKLRRIKKISWYLNLKPSSCYRGNVEKILAMIYWSYSQSFFLFWAQIIQLFRMKLDFGQALHIILWGHVPYMRNLWSLSTWKDIWEMRMFDTVIIRLEMFVKDREIGGCRSGFMKRRGTSDNISSKFLKSSSFH